MSSEGEDDDFDDLPASDFGDTGIDQATYTDGMLPIFATGSLVDQWLLEREHYGRKPPAARLYNPHNCRDNLSNFFSTKPSRTGDLMRQRRVTAVEAYVTCTIVFHDVHIVERSLDLLFSCTACMSELVTLTAANSDALYKLVLGGCREPESGSVHGAFTAAFEVVLRSATQASLPCFYGNLADFPCVDLGLCRCILRPLYAAIYYSNAQMMSVLLRYGADVRPEDTCTCEEPPRMHPLARVYKSLAANNWPPAHIIKDRDREDTEEYVRCHQIALLVMPTHDPELRGACYAFARTFTPVAEYEELMLEKGTLQHLCRVTVRAALARGRAMPWGVEKLPLPKQLQQYISYHDQLASL